MFVEGWRHFPPKLLEGGVVFLLFHSGIYTLPYYSASNLLFSPLSYPFLYFFFSLLVFLLLWILLDSFQVPTMGYIFFFFFVVFILSRYPLYFLIYFLPLFFQVSPRGKFDSKWFIPKHSFTGVISPPVFGDLSNSSVLKKATWNLPWLSVMLEKLVFFF